MTNYKGILSIVLVLVLALLTGAVATAAQSDDSAQSTPGEVPQPYLGITFDEAETGIVVIDVVPGSPAAEAGLAADDNITAFDGMAITAETLVDVFSGYQVGDTVTLSVERDGEQLELAVTLTEREVLPINLEQMPQFNRPFVGVSLQEAEAGVLIGGVNEGSPAADAGLQVDDMITALNGEDIATTEELITAIRELAPGDVVTFDVLRDDESLTIEVTLGAVPVPDFEGFDFGERGDDNFRFRAFPGGGNVRLGVNFQPITPELADEQSLSVEDGALIIEVLPDTPAAEAGLQADDIVTAVNDDIVDEERTLRDRLFAYEPGDTVALEVLRGDETLSIEVTLAEVSMEQFGFEGDIEDFFEFDFPLPEEFEQFNFDFPLPDIDDLETENPRT